LSETHQDRPPNDGISASLHPGASYFFTVNLEDRHLRLLTDHIGLLRSSFCDTRARHPFTIDAIVVLPDHLHAIWTLPEGDADYATRWRQIKSAFSRALPHDEAISSSPLRKGERGVWRRRYWEHTLRDQDDFAALVDYTHFNPVKHAHAPEPDAWPYSSIHRPQSVAGSG
jgi:putative transposase